MRNAEYGIGEGGTYSGGPRSHSGGEGESKEGEGRDIDMKVSMSHIPPPHIFPDFGLTKVTKGTILGVPEIVRALPSLRPPPRPAPLGLTE